MLITAIVLMTLAILLVLLILFTLFSPLILRLPQFGQYPSGDRLKRCQRSKNFRNGQFHNKMQNVLPKGSHRKFIGVLWKFLFSRKGSVTPSQPLPMAFEDLKHLPSERDFYVWFGHSSYLLSLHGVTFLFDPVFCAAAPFKFLNKPFRGTDRYAPEDMPENIDYLVITHDHYDHLDYETVQRLKGRVRHLVCPLGVGSHFESWGWDSQCLMEMDWGESLPLEGEWGRVHCLPSQHFSGRALKRNNTLWASFMLETPCGNIFASGDGGYGPHFKEIGERFSKIDLAILENGQYNEQWKYIHTLPEQLGQEADDLHAAQVVTVHHSKYVLAFHAWNEPLLLEKQVSSQCGFPLIVAELGAITELHLIKD